MKNILPITNIDEWKEIHRYIHYSPTNDKDELFFHTDYQSIITHFYFTGHLYRINDNSEGIEVRWEGNPFDLTPHF